MTLRRKLIAILAFVALVPVGVSAVLGLRVHRDAHDDQLAEAQRTSAGFGATLTDDVIERSAASLVGLARAIPWSQLDAGELEGALTLVYQQLAEVLAVQLRDRHGRPIGPSVTGPGDDDPNVMRPALSADGLEALRARGEERVGAVTFDGARAFVPIWVDVGDDGWRLAIALSLESTCAALSGANQGEGQLLLVGPGGEVVCADQPWPVQTVLDRAGARTMHTPAGEARSGRWAQSGHGLRVFAHTSVASIERSSERLRNQALFWLALGLVVALAAGFILAREITVPVRRLTEGADELAQGNLDYRLDADGRDELSRLAGAFNRMSAQIQVRDGEIRAWNQELQQRVAERTRELEDAQQQILESQKIAAVSSLAAGVAHEINNPLAGVLGLTQVLRIKASDKQRTTLDIIEAEARRIRDIVATLQSFSADYRGEGMTNVDLRPLLSHVCELSRGQVEARGVALDLDMPDRLAPVLGIAGQLEQVLLHVIDNARIATEDGHIRIQARQVAGGAVRIVVSDTGAGIAPEDLGRVFEPFYTTKKDWQGRGLGLTVAYRIVEQHRGTLKISSTLAEGTTVELSLPAAGGGAHLE